VYEHEQFHIQGMTCYDFSIALLFANIAMLLLPGMALNENNDAEANWRDIYVRYPELLQDIRWKVRSIRITLQSESPQIQALSLPSGASKLFSRRRFAR
jgi:hypothetical protein